MLEGGPVGEAKDPAVPIVRGEVKAPTIAFALTSAEHAELTCAVGGKAQYPRANISSEAARSRGVRENMRNFKLTN